MVPRPRAAQRPLRLGWGHSSAGRALEWHSRGRRFDPAWLHQPLSSTSRRPSRTKIGRMQTADASPPEERSELRLTLSALCASSIGIGLSRFAYTPLLPAIIFAGWFDSASAAYLGAANLGGYLAGALIA